MNSKLEIHQLKLLDALVLSTYLNRTIKDSKISLNLNFGHNSPASIQRMIVHKMIDNAWLALNDERNETDY